MKQNIFALVDCNSFFCSCERVFQPHLAKKPVVVLSNNDGCVVSRTDEAKALLIKMGEPYFKIRDFCEKNGVHVFSSNYALYGDLSGRVMQVLSTLVPEMEIYSIDEAFARLDGFRKPELKNFGQEIRKTIGQYTGVPVSIGIAPTKVLAKAANYMAKKNKEHQGVVSLFDYTEDELNAWLQKIPVQSLWGIGRKSAIKLQTLKIRTAFDLKCADERVIQKYLSINGKNIVEELRGISINEFDPKPSDKKQIISSRSFGRPVFELSELRESVANHVSSAAERLRDQGGVTRSVLVYVQTNRFKNVPQYYNSAVASLAVGSSATNKLIRHAFAVLDQIYREGYEYKKVGVIFMDIARKSDVQLDFFSEGDTPRDDKLMLTLDSVNRLEGRGALKFAACGIDQFWKMLSQLKSRNYTTRWRDLIEVGE